MVFVLFKTSFKLLMTRFISSENFSSLVKSFFLDFVILPDCDLRTSFKYDLTLKDLGYGSKSSLKILNSLELFSSSNFYKK